VLCLGTFWKVPSGQVLHCWLPRTAVEAIAAMSVLTHFESMMRGVLDGRDVLYFVSVSAAFLFLNGIVVEWKKAE